MGGYIYKLTNKVNGKPYIGQTRRTPEERFLDHIYRKDSVIGKAIDKYKAHNFTLEILEADVPLEKLNEREIFWIAFYNSMVPNGYNCTPGGQGNWERTPESIAKMSRKGQITSDETKRKLSLAKKGKPGNPHSNETKAHLSAISKNKRAVICVETDEEFESISAASRAKQITVQEISRACRNPGRIAGSFHWQFKDVPESEISSRCNKTTLRPVICIETGVAYESISAAARAYSVVPKGISRACNNPNRTSGGCHWKFKEIEPQAEIEPQPEIELQPEIESHEQATVAGRKTKPRPVICVETGEVFESTNAAGRHHNIDHTCIARACKNPYFTSCGFHWCFKIEPETVQNAQSPDLESSTPQA